MKALLKIINTRDDASRLLKICDENNVKVLHKKHLKKLSKEIIQEGGFSTNFGGYGSYSNLGLGDSFHSKWHLDGTIKKQFSNVRVCFEDSIDKDIIKKISD